MIALRRGPLHRSRLAFELWPDSSERQARTNLRKLLHELRQSLPDIARSALELAVDLDHLMTLGYVLTYAAIIAAESEDFPRLAELLADADLLWKRLSERYLIVVLEALRGWLEVCEGSTGGIEKIVRSVARSRTDAETLHLTYTLLLLARARGRSLQRQLPWGSVDAWPMACRPAARRL